MRRFTASNRYSVILPVHVANRLGFMSRETADRLRRELEQVAELASEGRQDSGALHLASDLTQLYVEADGYRLYYQVDRVNRTVVPSSVEEIS
jgi:mRNA-degrading endonuclease RelE of RelBE toxin-antitoxin system